MAKPAHIAAHDPVGPTTPELDDEPVYFTPNQQRIIRAGECARAEQQRLEQLSAFRTAERRTENPIRGVFRLNKGRAALT